MANWNPWHGCHKLSEGCKNCYVYRTDAKYGRDSSRILKTNNFDLPVRKNRLKHYKLAANEIVYTCFTSDFLLSDADYWRIDAWKMIKERSDLKFLFITKRIDRFYVNLPDDWSDGYENVAIGCTCENQKRVDYRLPIFLSLPIKHRFIVCEPLLENLEISSYLSSMIEGVIVGGESGQSARLCDFDWILNIRKQCIKKNVPFTFKQTGANFMIDGKIYTITRKHQHSQALKAGINIP